MSAYEGKRPVSLFIDYCKHSHSYVEANKESVQLIKLAREAGHQLEQQKGFKCFKLEMHQSTGRKRKNLNLFIKSLF